MWVGLENCMSKIQCCENTIVSRKIQMYTNEYEATEASSGRFLHTVPESRVFIL